MGEAKLNLDATAGELLPDPDLLLIVRRSDLGRDEILSYAARTRDPALGLNFAEETTEPLGLSPRQAISDLYRDMDRLSSPQSLADQGAYLCRKLMPPKLRRQLWRIRDRVRTVQIYSRELWIPWELLRLEDGEHPEHGGFLGELFALTLWILDRSVESADPEGSRPAATLPLGRVALIAPTDTQLDQVERERQHLLGYHERMIHDIRRQVIEVPARRQTLQTAFSQDFDGWHFSGHSLAGEKNSDRSFLVLEQRERLDPTALRPGILGHRTPLIFLNACKSAWGHTALTGVGGLANAFLKAGAGAFIGSRWRISDVQAFELASLFYQNFIDQQMPIGEAMRQARLELHRRHPADATWLAHTIYAHPMARCAPTAEGEVAPPDSPDPAESTPERLESASWQGHEASREIPREQPRPSPRKLLLAAVMATVIALSFWLTREATQDPPASSSYRITVLIVDESGRFVDDALLETSQGEKVRTPRSWEIRIDNPTTRTLRLQATQPNAFLEGHRVVELSEDTEPTFEIVIRQEESEVRGIVVDAEGRAVAGARVSVVGFPEEAVTTDESGQFRLPAHAAAGQLLRLRAEKGDAVTDLPARAGKHPMTLLLEGS